jgi:transporter family-2 protein
MSRLLAVLASGAVGALVALQPPVNSELAKRTSVLGAAFISVLMSAIAIGVIAAIAGDLPQLRRAAHVNWFYLTGGVYGAALVAVSLLTVRSLGAGGVVAAIVTGQLIVSAVLDHYGVLGLVRTALTPARFAGIALLLAGTALVTMR